VDPDLGSNSLIRYSIRSEDFKAEDHFTVDPVSGDVRTTQLSFDYETYTVLEGRTNYIFWLLASDNGSSPKTSEVEVKVDIQDVNDEPPDIKVTFYPDGAITNYRIWENEVVDKQRTLAVVSVTDPDKGSAKSNNLTSWLEGGDGLFHLNSATGSLTLAKSLDYETKKHFNMAVVASDNGKPPLTSKFYFNVTVLDKNDNYPKFNEPFFSGIVQENSQVGKKILRVQAHDDDEGDFALITFAIKSIYAMTANPRIQNWFTINKTTGWIEVAQPDIDRETVDVVSLIVEASNSKADPILSSTVNVTIYIKNVNDHSPEFSIPGDKQYYEFSVKEDQPVGTVVGTVRAVDKDVNSSLINYRLQSENETSFAIDSKTGKIKTTAMLDYETVTEYNFQIVVSDGGVASESSASVLVTVKDVNDNFPKFEESTPVYVETSQLDENNKLLILKATDPDQGDHVKYELLPSRHSESLFTIDKNTGEISARYPLTYVKPQNYSYVVTATDAGNHTSVIMITIKVVPPGGVIPPEPDQNKEENGITSTLTILVIVLAVLFILMVSAAVLFILYSRGYRCHSRHDVEKGKPDLRTVIMARRSSSRVQFANEDIFHEYEDKDLPSKRCDPEGQNTPDKEEGRNEVFFNQVAGTENMSNGRSRKPLQVSDQQELQREAEEGSDADSSDSGHQTSDSVTTPSSIRLPPGSNTYPFDTNTSHEEGHFTSHL
jgi:hypothetical protein